METHITCPSCNRDIKISRENNSDVGDINCPFCKITIGLDSKDNTIATWDAPPVDKLNDELEDRYEIISLLGKGGMGAVYKAKDTRLDRIVAIKVLPLELGNNTDALARFQREAKSLASLDHPNIIHIHDYGQTKLGHLYFVMEFIEGQDLQQLRKSNNINLPSALDIISQVCAALHFAHQNGIIHRDIKPANILVGTDGRVRVADFGLAKTLASHDPQKADQNATTTGAVMGTPDYMAPEQKDGSGIDNRADVYSLGVMIYDLLTGAPPRGAWAAPSHKVQIDVRLDEIVLKALQETPEARYQHISEMEEDVNYVKQSSGGNPLPKGSKVKPLPSSAINNKAKSIDRVARMDRGKSLFHLTKILGVIVILGIVVALSIYFSPKAQNEEKQQPVSTENSEIKPQKDPDNLVPELPIEQSRLANYHKVVQEHCDFGGSLLTTPIDLIDHNLLLGLFEHGIVFVQKWGSPQEFIGRDLNYGQLTNIQTIQKLYDGYGIDTSNLGEFILSKGTSYTGSGTNSPASFVIHLYTKAIVVLREHDKRYHLRYFEDDISHLKRALETKASLEKKIEQHIRFKPFKTDKLSFNQGEDIVLPVTLMNKGADAITVPANRKFPQKKYIIGRLLCYVERKDGKPIDWGHKKSIGRNTFRAFPIEIKEKKPLDNQLDPNEEVLAEVKLQTNNKISYKIEPGEYLFTFELKNETSQKIFAVQKVEVELIAKENN